MNPRFNNENLTLFGFNTCVLDEEEGRLGRSNSNLIAEPLGAKNNDK